MDITAEALLNLRLQRLDEQGVIRLAKATELTGGEFERADWPDGEWVPFKVIKTEKRFKYQSTTDEEINLTVEALEGDVKGQWAYINVNHIDKKGQPNLHYDKDGAPASKWLQLLLAVRPDFNVKVDEAHDELEDFLGEFFMGFVEPRTNSKYPKFLKFKPMSVEDRAKYALGAEVKMSDTDLPF